jgi:hypothetical protein
MTDHTYFRLKNCMVFHNKNVLIIEAYFYYDEYLNHFKWLHRIPPNLITTHQDVLSHGRTLAYGNNIIIYHNSQSI